MGISLWWWWGSLLALGGAGVGTPAMGWPLRSGTLVPGKAGAEGPNAGLIIAPSITHPGAMQCPSWEGTPQGNEEGRGLFCAVP